MNLRKVQNWQNPTFHHKIIFGSPTWGYLKQIPEAQLMSPWESPALSWQDGDIPRLKCPQCKKTCCLLCPKPQHFRCFCCSCWCWCSCWWCWWWYVWTCFLNSWRSWDKTSQPHKKKKLCKNPFMRHDISTQKKHNKHQQKQGVLLGGGFTPTCGNDPIWLYDIFQMGWNHQPV